MSRSDYNLIGTIKVELNLYDIDNEGDEFSLEIINENNNQLINKINNDLKYLDIIRNNNKIRAYESIIKDNEIIIKDSINRKKQDILEIAKYMISKEKEILYYKKQIDDLNNNIEHIQKSVCENVQPPLSPKKDIVVEGTPIVEDIKINKNIDLKKIIESYFNNVANENIQLNFLNETNSKINLKYKNLNCYVELKNNKNNIGKNEIKNYLNYVRNSNYNCGIYISSNSGYTANSNIKDFDMLTINGKSVIFISNFNKDHNKINYAIKLLQYVSTNKTNEEDSIEINTYIQYINKYYDMLEYNMDQCDDKITKYTKKITKYESKINDVKNKLNHTLLKKNEYSDEILLLEEIPTLQLSIVNKSLNEIADGPADNNSVKEVQEEPIDTSSELSTPKENNKSNYTYDNQSVTSEEENIIVDN